MHSHTAAMTASPPPAAARLFAPEPAEPAPRRSLRIAVVTETWPPEVNGVATTIAQFVSGLVGRGHTVQLVRPRQAGDEALDDAIPDRDALQEQVLVGGLPIPRYPHLKLGLPSGRELARRWTQRRPDLVHLVTEGPLGWSALHAARRLRLPISSDFRTNFHAYSRHYGIGWLERPIVGALRHFHNRTLCTMVPTEALRRDLTAQGFERLRVVARGVDTALFDPRKRSEELRRSWGAGPTTPVLVHVGRLAREKNLGVLLSAYDTMRQVRPELRLVLVGDGPARAEIAARCPQAVMAGLRGGEALAAYYASADMFLFPSLTETYGNVTPEAMASGLPVLAYDYAAASQLIEHRRNGLLAAFDNEAAFVRAALRLVADPAGAAAMGRAARASAEAQSWERVVGQLEAVFLATAAGAPVDSARDRIGAAPYSPARRA